MLRVQRVNSLDKMIDDGESEHKDIPVDQEFFYRADGKVSHVRVKDRSGKVLYVKSYNDKLNTMAFQYDDEHGTERTINNSTVGYTAMINNDNGGKGKISRWWIDYDNNGFANQIRYAGLDNSPVGDENGIYGFKYERDEKGRPTSINYIGINGEPMPTKWGLGIKKFYYDNKDNWVKAEYLTVDGDPSTDDKDGTPIYELKYDEDGRLIAAYHKNFDGDLVMPQKNGIAGVHYEYNNGQIIKITFIDTDKNPQYFKNEGYASYTMGYDANGYCNEINVFDELGNPCENSFGYTKQAIINDTRGNVLEVWTYNLADSLAENQDGIAGYKYDYDSIGNQIKYVHYDKDRNPVKDKSGIVGQEIKYDDRGLWITATNLNEDLIPGPDTDGITICTTEYDKRGNRTKTFFYKADGETLVGDVLGYAMWENVYDDKGNIVENRHYDTNLNLTTNKQIGYAKCVYTFDENGNKSSARYYDSTGKLTLHNNVAGYDYKCDQLGNILEERPIGVDGKHSKKELTSRYEYDNNNNITKHTLFNDDKPAINSNDIHKYVYKYNNRNLIVEERHYDTNDKLVKKKDNKWAIGKFEYDNKGQCTKHMFFGTDEKPCVNDEGWSISTHEYNKFGNVIKECYYDISGQPCDPNIMVPIGICDHDKWGRRIYVASKDGNDNFIINPNLGASIIRLEYDNHDNKTKVSYFDTKDKPIISKNKYHIVRYAYNTGNQCIEESYYGTDDKPINAGTYHKVVKKYVPNRNEEEEIAYYDKNNRPTKDESGIHKLRFTYTDDYQPKKMIAYNPDGSQMASASYINGNWQLDQQKTDWRVQARELQSYLPQTIQGENGYAITMQSLNIIDSRNCELIMKLNMPKSQFTADELSELKEGIEGMTKELESEFGHAPYVTTKLYDSTGSLIYSIKI